MSTTPQWPMIDTPGQDAWSRVGQYSIACGHNSWLLFPHQSYTVYVENPSSWFHSQTMAKWSALSPDEHNAKHVRVEALSALQDPGAWAILERFLTTDLTFGDMEDKFHAYLGDRHRPLEWTPTKLAIFSGERDDALSLTNLLALKHQYIPEDDDIEEAPPLTPKIDFLEISFDNDGEEDDIEVMDFPIRSRKNLFLDIEAGEEDKSDDEIEGGVLSRASVTLLPAPRHNLADAIHRIEQSYQSGSSSTIHRRSPEHTRKTAPLPTRNIPTRMYVFTVNVSAREFLAEHLEKQGHSVVISPWIAAHLYVTSDSPLTIMSTVPESLKTSMKKWDRISNEEEAVINALRLKFPYPAWLRIKRGKYRDSIAYVYEPEQKNMFMTVLIPPKEFPYDMPKGATALFDPSRLPTPLSDILRDGEVVGYKFKGEEYYSGLLKKNFHRYCTELVHVPHPDAIRLHVQSGWDTPFCRKTEISFSKQLLRQGDLVRLTTPDLLGQICTVISTDHAFGGSVKLGFKLDGREKAIEAKLDHVERVFNVGDEVSIIAGGYLGVQGHIVERDDDIFTICQFGMLEEIEISKYYLDRRPIDWTLQGHMPAQSYVDPLPEPNTIEIGDYVKVTIGDLWASAGFIWFQDDEGVVRAVDFVGACLTLETELSELVRPNPNSHVVNPNFVQVTVPIRFVMKTRNAPLDTFNKFINKEVFVIGGVKKGYRATLNDISTDTCIIAVHGQPRMTVRLL
ncbi:uncharacterized protein HD556DRAFT_1314446 [Suillus plorans]|uniref:KOW domain-containing protein n=1 Tax=Suillus plorans TaxID=116603 RepID=A0A9P7AA78_9AGAM|nr:uncharacterized protein HD556DRAFT_1314446 [Suillus plorans]KAG1785181.1 hypothetical protein HD556DRAFT_1314446 [Suillus plorans]